MKLLKEREKTLGRILGSAKKESACVKVENASHLRSRGNFNEKIEVLQAEVDFALMEVSESSQENVTRVA